MHTVRAVLMFVKEHSVLFQEEEDEDECKTLAYGRRDCAKLAVASPVLAIRNADNFCYYISDVNKLQH